jgi:hypothetical protein
MLPKITGDSVEFSDIFAAAFCFLLINFIFHTSGPHFLKYLLKKTN